MATKFISFKPFLVREITLGNKTETRREVLPALNVYTHVNGNAAQNKFDFHFRDSVGQVETCPYGQPGDELLVREDAWMWCEMVPNGKTATGKPRFRFVPMRTAPVFYCADHPNKPLVGITHPETGNTWLWRKKLSRFLPRWACRVKLGIVSVGVQRLQDMTDADALAEGAAYHYTDREMHTIYEGKWREEFKTLWTQINGEESWSKNPWVWVIKFTVLENKQARAFKS